jgi:hypothetical protein
MEIVLEGEELFLSFLSTPTIPKYFSEVITKFFKNLFFGLPATITTGFQFFARTGSTTINPLTLTNLLVPPVTITSLPT